MARKSETREGTELGIDMTPMIDVVFQLIIFFMIVSDMTQQDLADITLPVADTAVDDEMEHGHMIVNIYPSGEIEIKKRKYPTLDDVSAAGVLRTYLANEVAKGEKDEMGLSERSLLIRADKTTKFKEVQKVMRICGENGIKIYKIDLAAAQNEQ